MSQHASAQSGNEQTAMDRMMMENWTEEMSVEQFNETPDWTPPPVNIYHFRLVRKDPNTPVNPMYDTTGKKVQAKFYFVIIDCEDPTLNGIEIRQFYTISLNEKANLRPIVEALIGRNLLPTDKMGWKDGFAADGSTIVGIGGKTMTATLTHDRRDNGKVYARLMGPIPYRPQPVAAPVAAAPIPAAAPPEEPPPF